MTTLARWPHLKSVPLRRSPQNEACDRRQQHQPQPRIHVDCAMDWTEARTSRAVQWRWISKLVLAMNSMGQAVENTQNTQLNRLNHRQQIWPLSSPSRTLPVLGAKNLKTSALGSNMFLTRLLLPMLDWHQSLIQQNSKAVRNFCDCL